MTNLVEVNFNELHLEKMNYKQKNTDKVRTSLYAHLAQIKTPSEPLNFTPSIMRLWKRNLNNFGEGKKLTEIKKLRQVCISLKESREATLKAFDLSLKKLAKRRQ